ncbi:MULTISPECIES: TetR/AcrR family transcriptional regulator [unclassified Nonomuraea]|uniref:TetR/AcrR family transcriptional regulator n=1 Tax=unclassified Nonomuraea TaxID=2593643 RepID=UPI00273B3D61|nr:TetR family transcriptional regulator [Nonomuraea sp. G32]MDP4501166.1 TetR family transcriptional regulator [Nonomuraea sp. G32]
MADERGRRPGNPQTRDEILEAAIAAFLAKGYRDTTIRGVAREAGVDPALVMHFFGTKDGLFEAAINGSMPVALMMEALDGDEEHLAERLSRRYVELWEDPAHGPRMSAVLQAATATSAAADLLKHLMRQELLGPIARRLSSDHAEVRALLAASQLVGIAMLRYVLKVEPLASLPADVVAAAVAPTLQRYLTGALSLEEIAVSR